MNLEVGTLQDGAPKARLAQPAVAVLHDKERIRLLLYCGLLVLDCVAIAAAFMAVGLLYLDDDYMRTVTTMCVVLVPIYAVIALNGQAYTIDVIVKPARGMVRAVTALVTAILAVVLIAFYLKASAEMSRFVFGAGTLLACAFIVAERGMFGVLADRLLGANPSSDVVIVDDVNFACPSGVMLIEARAAGVIPDITDPMMLDRLGRFLKNAERVVVACPPDRRLDWAMALKGANVTGEIIAAELDEVGAIGTGRFDTHVTMRVSCGPLAMRERVTKRLFDLTLASVGLIMIAPLLLLVALIIKLDSPGPILFVQERLGRGNRLFNMYKFRSMRADRCDSAGTVSTMRDDDRITRVGRIIRATSIDELPQILNVLLGDMSIVGPRPHALGSTAGAKLFWEVDTRYWHRHASKPGITGLAQVRGYRGATHESADLTNRLQADLEYLAGWTIWRDISILFATFRVLVHKNAF